MRELSIDGVDATMLRALISNKQQLETQIKTEFAKIDEAMGSLIKDKTEKAGFPAMLQWRLEVKEDGFLLTEIEPPAQEEDLSPEPEAVD